MDLILPYKWVKEYLKTELSAMEFAKAISTGGPSIERWNYDEKIDDNVLKIEVTSNRIDMFSVIGIAREGSAIMGLEFLYKNPSPNLAVVKPISLKVSVENFKSCPRYSAIVLDNVKVGQSPDWIKQRLEVAGINSVNNVVDITNYVMLEYGQPIHAFDYAKLQNAEIIIRNAKENEEIITLDKVTHKLATSNLIIADSSSPIAVAGVMGGLKSGVTTETKTIVVESANFEPTQVRKTARGLNLITEASTRLEKGLNIESPYYAILRVVELLQQLAGGEVASELIDVKEKAFSPNVIEFRPAIIERILGIKLSEDEIIKILEKLEFTCVQKEDLIEVTVPYFRTEDIQYDYDLVEEVARIYGYPNIPSILPEGEIPAVQPMGDLVWEERIMEWLSDIGFIQTFSYGMLSDKQLEMVSVNPEDVLKVKNPLTSDFVYMRKEAASTMLSIAASNEDLEPKLKLFELDKVYLPTGPNALPIEQSTLAVVVNSEKSSDAFFELKGVWEYIIEKIGMNKEMAEYLSEDISEPYKKGASAKIKYEEYELGHIGVISDKAKKLAGVKKETAILEINFDNLYKIIQKTIKSYKAIPKYPSTYRDFAMLFDKSISWKQVRKIVIDSSGAIFKDVELFDTYEGKGIPENQKSLAFRVTLISDERTLNEDEINTVSESIIKNLEKEFGAKLR